MAEKKTTREHTPLPWKWSNGAFDPLSWADEYEDGSQKYADMRLTGLDGAEILPIRRDRHSVIYDGYGPNPGDLRFVELACNSHYDLLAACRETLSVLSEWDETNQPDDGPEWMHIGLLRAAIAKATKQENRPMKMYRVNLTRKMEIQVTARASTPEKAESEAIGLAEAVGYTNLDPRVDVYLEGEAEVVDVTEF